MYYAYPFSVFSFSIYSNLHLLPIFFRVLRITDSGPGLASLKMASSSPEIRCSIRRNGATGRCADPYEMVHCPSTSSADEYFSCFPDSDDFPSTHAFVATFKGGDPTKKKTFSPSSSIYLKGVSTYEKSGRQVGTTAFEMPPQSFAASPPKRISSPLSSVDRNKRRMVDLSRLSSMGEAIDALVARYYAASQKRAMLEKLEKVVEVLEVQVPRHSWCESSPDSPPAEESTAMEITTTTQTTTVTTVIEEQGPLPFSSSSPSSLVVLPSSSTKALSSPERVKEVKDYARIPLYDQDVKVPNKEGGSVDRREVTVTMTPCTSTAVTILPNTTSPTAMTPVNRDKEMETPHSSSSTTAHTPCPTAKGGGSPGAQKKSVEPKKASGHADKKTVTLGSSPLAQRRTCCPMRLASSSVPSSTTEHHSTTAAGAKGRMSTPATSKSKSSEPARPASAHLCSSKVDDRTPFFSVSAGAPASTAAASLLPSSSSLVTPSANEKAAEVQGAPNEIKEEEVPTAKWGSAASSPSSRTRVPDAPVNTTEAFLPPILVATARTSAATTPSPSQTEPPNGVEENGIVAVKGSKVPGTISSMGTSLSAKTAMTTTTTTKTVKTINPLYFAVQRGNGESRIQEPMNVSMIGGERVGRNWKCQLDDIAWSCPLLRPLGAYPSSGSPLYPRAAAGPKSLEVLNWMSELGPEMQQQLERHCTRLRLIHKKLHALANFIEVEKKESFMHEKSKRQKLLTDEFVI